MDIMPYLEGEHERHDPQRFSNLPILYRNRLFRGKTAHLQPSRAADIQGIENLKDCRSATAAGEAMLNPARGGGIAGK